MNPAKDLGIQDVGDVLAIAAAFQRLDPTPVESRKIPPLYGTVSSQAAKVLSQACLATAHPLSLELAAGIISGKISKYEPPMQAAPKAKKKTKKRKLKKKAQAKTKAKKARKRR